MPGVSRRIGPLTACPDVPEITALLQPLGELFVVPEERLNMGGLSAFLSTYFELQNTLVAASVAAGASPEEARRFVVAELAMLADTARVTPPEKFADLVVEHQTKGGLNERVRERLLAAGWFSALPEALLAVTQLGWQKLG